MSLMTSFSIGVSGLRTSQNSLNTTAHNLANVDTEKYVRQQVLLKDTMYNNIGNTAVNTLQTGLGVTTQVVRQVRDVFLDKEYRKETGRDGFYDAHCEAVAEIEELTGELQGVAFQDSLEDLWVAIQELAKEPDSLVTRSSLVDNAVSFIQRAQNIHQMLKEYQNNINTKVQTLVDRINEIGDEIIRLNKEIVKYEAAGVERANDKRDERNGLLDELGHLINISYAEDMKGYVSVYAEGIPFISDNIVFKMDTITAEELDEKNGIEPATNVSSGMLIPIWPSFNDREVFNLTTEISTEKNNDIGELKGFLLARGRKVANYTDIPVAPEEADYTDENGVLDEDAYKAAVAQFEKIDTPKYETEIDPSIIMSVEAQFDQLIHGIVTTINDILCPNKEVTLLENITVTRSDGSEITYEAGTKIKILDEETAGVGLEGTMGEELFSRKSVERYSDSDGEITVEYADGTAVTGSFRIYNDEFSYDNYSLYTLGEVEVNSVILENKSKIPLSVNTNTGDIYMDKVNELLNTWDECFATLKPTDLTYNNFNDYYSAMIGEIANRGEQYNRMSSNQSSMVESIENQRQEVMGVSSDEELTNLIMYQHAYNASSRYINVINSMLETVIERL